MPKSRRSFSPEQKAAIVREHLLEKVPVSEVCDKHGLVPTVFYRWQKELFEGAAAVLAHKNRKPVSDALVRQNEALKAKLAHKDEVIAEIMADHIALKKELGEL